MEVKSAAAPIIFFFTRLKPGAEAAAYERFEREVDYPFSAQVPSIISFLTHRVAGSLAGQADFDYVERIEVRDLEAYRRDLASPQAQELFGELFRYIEPLFGVITVPLEE